MRTKENAIDYRFMPEPDLPPLVLSSIEGFDLDDISASIPELPKEAEQRLAKQYSLPADVCAVIVSDPANIKFFEEAVAAAVAATAAGEVAVKASQQTASLLCNVLFSLMNENEGDRRLTSLQLGETVALLQSGDITNKMAKDIINALYLTEPPGCTVSSFVERENMKVLKDASKLAHLCEEVINSPGFLKQLEDYGKAEGDDRRKGKIRKFFFGKVMKNTKGMADARALDDVLKECLDNTTQR